jgi:hypothetical protein
VYGRCPELGESCHFGHLFVSVLGVTENEFKSPEKSREEEKASLGKIHERESVQHCASDSDAQQIPRAIVGCKDLCQRGQCPPMAVFYCHWHFFVILNLAIGSVQVGELAMFESDRSNVEKAKQIELAIDDIIQRHHRAFSVTLRDLSFVISMPVFHEVFGVVVNISALL